MDGAAKGDMRKKENSACGNDRGEGTAREREEGGESGSRETR